jgi:hypothetical protein
MGNDEDEENIVSVSKVFWFALIAVLLDGCANETAHENFKATLERFVGKDIAHARNFFGSDDIEVKKLPNGHSEYRLTTLYKFRGYGPCTKIFEVDPTSQKILRADFVGSAHDCIVPL